MPDAQSAARQIEEADRRAHPTGSAALAARDREEAVANLSTPQITVLDAGGQYCHLIARKIRDLGVYADVKPSETPASELTGRKGIIISGGPDSVYEPGSPQIDPQILSTDSAVLGICYGQQLMTYVLGGGVRKGEKGEYGFARFHTASLTRCSRT